ncbi:MAG: hypothetical protein WC261_08290 [Synergistaceae bacterium]|jgi:hypothetical protein
MRTYTIDDPAAVNEIVQAANLVSVSDTAVELRFEIGHMDKASDPEFVVQAGVMVRIMPNPCSGGNTSYDGNKAYALTATILVPLEVSAVPRYDIQYPATSMLHILDLQLHHLTTMLLAGHTTTQSTPSVDWQAVAEELLTAHTATSESIDCRPCPLKEYCSRAPGESCYKYIKDVLCKKHTKEAHA